MAISTSPPIHYSVEYPHGMIQADALKVHSIESGLNCLLEGLETLERTSNLFLNFLETCADDDTLEKCSGFKRVQMTAINGLFACNNISDGLKIEVQDTMNKVKRLHEPTPKTL